ncbi:MAG: methyltransferase domain-containing protein [Deltaproteobacteria bacterium]|nr:MAG: methyltransferase domain-containing protein [Deltaproteobacteria bacterium]
MMRRRRQRIVATHSKRTHRFEKLARIYDREILPIWSQPFGRMLLRDLAIPDKGQILDVACGTGYPAVEIVRRMGPGCRLIAIDGSSALLDVARNKIAEAGAKGVFFRTESAVPRLSFADEVYDLVVCNLGLPDMPDPAAALADFARVTKAGGEVRATLPLRGSFQEFYDIYREVLVKHDKHDTLERLDAHLARYPTVEECESWLARAGLAPARVDVDEFSLLFKSSREFFFAPVIEYGPLPEWKRVAGKGQELQDVFWYIKEAIDAYFADRAFEVTIKAGCLIGTKPFPEDEAETGQMEPIDAGEEVELDTDQIELADEPPVPAAEEYADVPLDAFVEGRKRPDHLDD